MKMFEGLSFSKCRPCWHAKMLHVVTDMLEDNVYTWDDGSPLSYESWRGGQPDMKDGRMDCCYIDPGMMFIS